MNFKKIISSIFLITFAIIALAQDVIVTVTPVQTVLPPQALLYISDPGKYFNVQLTNTSIERQDVYLAMQVEQVMPSTGLSITIPTKYQPSRPFSIPANGVLQLTSADMKTMFNHIPSNAVNATPGLFDNYLNGSFGLLPEGEYEVHLTAYKWTGKKIEQNPIVISNPVGGMSRFTVCYKAQAPQFLLPSVAGTAIENTSVATVDVLSPLFTWTAPVVTCNPAASGFKYNFKVVEVLPHQNPEEAIERNPVIYHSDGLVVPQCMIPLNVITTQMYVNKTYASQVTAVSTTGNALNYVMIENKGKSSYRLFKLKTDDMDDEPQTEEGTEGKNNKDDEDKSKSDDKADDDKDSADNSDSADGSDNVDDREYHTTWGNVGMSDSICTDSLYTFRNPTITLPAYIEGTARKEFFGHDVKVEWDPVWFLGGEGSESDTLKFKYEVNLYNGGADADRMAALESEPIYTKITEELNDSILWDKLKDKVEKNDYLVLRITPTVVNGQSVAFVNDSVNTIDFAMADMLSKKYFECSNMVDITNTTPTKLTAEQLKNEVKAVDIGEYQLILDGELKGSGESGFTGKGHVEWKPLGIKTMVCVEFDGLKINTDNQVYEGTARTYAMPGMTDMAAVDKLFSDWGIDNLIGDTGIPYASELQSSATGKVKDLAKKINLSNYYSYVKKGGAIYDLLGKGEIQDLYMPVSLPKEINSSPVDIQIVSMTFAPEYATMNVMGEFALPGSNYLTNDILVLGAPRLCISPDNIVPEGGTVALLSDFGIKDPKSGYTMTFKAPKDVVNPIDGCYIAWKDYKFEILGIDMDMKIPNLVKDVNGKAGTEMPTLNVRASIAKWDDWMVDDITIDPFQVKDLPGWTFTAQDIVYDHSYYRSSNKMGSFPTGYDKTKAGLTTSVTTDEGTYSISQKDSWQGLFIKQLSLKFPKALEFGTSGDKRLSLSVNNMFVDKSGASLVISANNLVSAKTGKVGGWEFSLDKASLSFVQNNFTKCNFSGKFGVPLLQGQIGYTCNIYRQNNSSKSDSQYAYVFKTQQTEGLSLDFFLANATFEKSQTYFLLESVPTSSGSLQTNVELMMGGKLTIGGTNYLNNKIKDSSLPLKFEIPGVHFCGFRIANCASSWTSKYESSMQKNAKNATLSGIKIYTATKDINLGSSTYLNFGKWSLASAQKKLGPFEFSLDKYNFKYSNKVLSASLEGSIKLIDGIDLSAGAGITVNANVTVPTSIKDFKNFKASYKNTTFDKASFDSKFAGVELSGSLTVERNDKTKEGYTGTLKFKMPGDLFTVNANGGYYKYSSSGQNFRYGFFNMQMSSAAGLRIDPVVINSISGGFYYNCVKNTETTATPKNGIIGVIAGMGLSTSAGKDMLNGDFDMTVVYDKKNKRLTTFMFNGTMQAVSGLINSKASIVYQNDDKDQYFALNLTADAKADGAQLAKSYASKYSSELSSLQSTMKSLNSNWEKAVSNVSGGLKGKIDDTSGSNKGHKTDAKGGDTSVKASAGATITLDFKVTMKEKGQKLPKARWHVYLGEPDFSKRCSITIIDFKSKIVNVKIGANCYLCLGNELPNNGQLPDIPAEVRNFLDGSTKGAGVVSDDVSKANRARTKALEDFNAEVVGGLMLGAQVYGYIDLDLGIFYGSMGATAGFDMSVKKLGANSTCTNLGGAPGWNRWYGEGQLYAYLYAKFGIHINLGFWDKRFDIVDAGIGGVLAMGGPKPTYFTGKARCKLKLLGGLVNINRSFEFECGDRCDLFLGNALDNFKLFGTCSLGDTLKTVGWNEKNKISPNLLVHPTYNTEAPLDEHFRVLDETELNRLAKDYNGDKDDLKSQASRTFIFHTNSYVTLREYSRATESNSYLVNTQYFYLRGNQRFSHIVNMSKLNPNRYYVMEVTGWSKELNMGSEIDPLKYNQSKNKYISTPWKQTVKYYFCTTETQSIPDCPNLEEYVAVAYPSYYNKIKDPEALGTSYARAYTSDVRAPLIALLADLRTKSFQKGTLKWKLCDSYGKVLDETDNYWAYTNNSCSMTPSRKFNNVKDDGWYVIKLDYTVSSSKKTASKTRVTTMTTNLMSLRVHTYAGSWQTGYQSDNYRYSMEYERPFVGMRLSQANFNYNIPNYTDRQVAEAANTATIGGMPLRIHDPYSYISYLSNFVYVGGFELSTGRLSARATTSQSCIYTDKGGVYEGKLGRGVSYRVTGSLNAVRSLSIYDSSQWGLLGFPIPELNSSKYDYVLTSDERTPVYIPSTSNAERLRNMINDIKDVYYLAQDMSKKLNSTSQDIQTMGTSNFETNKVNKVEAWVESHTGVDITATRNGKSLAVPAYQIPITWGSQFANVNSRKKVSMWGSYDDLNKNDERPHEKICEEIWFSFMGGEMDHKVNKSKNRSKETFTVTNDMLRQLTSISVETYRVNMYDYNNCMYRVMTGLNNGTSIETIKIDYPLTK